MITKRLNFINLVLLVFLQNAKAEMVEAQLLIPTQEIEIDYEADQAHKEKYLKEEAQKKFRESLKGKDLALFEEAFAQASLKVKVLVNSMLKGEQYATRYKNILLTGPSGSGKTTLAQAIAYKLQRKCIVINAPSLLGHFRDQAAENVRQMFKDLVEDKEKPILIMEEINALTDDHTSEHSDTKHTAMQFWTLLDERQHDKDFLLIGTTNVTKKMPHQLQTRFKMKTFLIDYPSLDSRKRTITFYLNKLGIQKDATCDSTYLHELAQKTVNFSQRDIEALIDTSILLFTMENPNVITKKITKRNLDQAYSELIQENEKFWDFSEQTTDEERRHKETLAQNKQQFEESQETQIKIAEWNLLFQSCTRQDFAWPEGVRLINLCKSIAFPNKKPLSKIIIIPGTPGFFGTSDEKKLVPNNEIEIHPIVKNVINSLTEDKTKPK